MNARLAVCTALLAACRSLAGEGDVDEVGDTSGADESSDSSGSGDDASESESSETSGTESASDSGSDSGSDSTEADGSTEESESETGDDDPTPDDDCPEGLVTYPGTVDANTNADLVVLEGVECIEGHLLLSAGLSGPFTELESLQIILGQFGVYDYGERVDQLESLLGLESLNYAGSVLIQAPSLTSLDGLNGLVEVDGEFQIKSATLADVDGLENLTVVRRMFILGAEEEGAPWIEQIEGLGSLEEVGGVFIFQTWGLSSLAGLEGVSVVNIEGGGSIDISNNPHLTDVTPFGGGQPVVIPGHLSIGENPMLPNCNAMQLAETLEVLGNVSYDDNLPDACGG